MGLDSVELVMEIEESFDIIIPDEDASKILTVGDMHSYVIDKLKQSGLESGCATQRAFYLLRRNIIKELSPTQKKIKPKDLTECYFPKKDRKRSWKKYKNRLKLKFPNLQRPRWLVNVLIIIYITMSILYIFKQSVSNHPWVLTFILYSIVFCYVSSILTGPFARNIPSECKTLGGFTKTLLAKNTKEIGLSRFLKSDVWDILCFLTSYQLGIEPETIKPESRFVEDLGCD